MFSEAATAPVESPSITPRTPPQGRKRPLRTYSRRSIQSQEHQRDIPASDERKGTATPDSGRPQTTSPIAKQTSDLEAKRPARGSILAYFKPLSLNSDTAPSDVTFPDPAEPVSTPPLSPLQVPKPRKRRRLTTRPQISTPDKQEREDAAEGTGEDIHPSGDSTGEVATPQPSSPILDTIYVRTDTPPDTPRSVLREVAVNTLQDGLAITTAGPGTKSQRRPGKRTVKDLTQTTLSLSVQKEPGFTICAVCDILYNPLNEKDRREHKRRHAAASRSRKRVSSLGPVW